MWSRARRWWAVLPALWLALASPYFAKDAPEGLLDRARAHMRDVLASQPNYTCLETVERAVRSRLEYSFRIRDTLRLEVALVNHKEMFTRPGSREFEEASIRAFVPIGMVNDGHFALYQDAVAAFPQATFVARGETRLGARRVAVYDFRMPQEVGMQVYSMGAEARAAYRGSLYVDPQTLDTVRLEVTAEELPAKLSLKRLKEAVNYGRVQVGGAALWLPVTGETFMLNFRDDEARNRTSFSECREYSAKSSLTFGGGAGGDANRPTVKREVRLPAGIPVTVRLESEMNTENMAVGDQVYGQLDQPLERGKELFLPKGASVTGNISNEQIVGNFAMVGIVLRDAESEDASAMLKLTYSGVTGRDVADASRFIRIFGPVDPREGRFVIRPGVHWLTGDIVLHGRTLWP